MNWDKFNRGVFLVNILGVLYNPKTKMILIGRRESDPYIENLTWGFPGGRSSYKDEIEDYLKSEIKNKTGLEIKNEKIIFAKTYPENREFMSIYYYCEPVDDSIDGVAGGKFVELKWVKPSEVEEYFTTSLHPKMKDYLMKLEEVA
ncbi:MAG: NUDIX domain-containing protein [Patescibacteria group bacterium]|jgi:ADP-ribose pyrophosphatase YjhB (NUDIX family)|nr:NUDIX domain-containing protein [Patescibacteria group bacterium]